MKESPSYHVEVGDKTGKIVERIDAPSRSYVQQWNQVINVHARQAASTIKDTDGVNRTISPTDTNLRINSGAGVTSYGIQVGKGATAVTISDYRLEAPLAEGTAPDQLTHLAMLSTPPSIVGPECSFSITRAMVNNSSATITGIREIGAYMRMGSYYGLAFRDVLPGSFSIPDGGAITVTYTLKVIA